MDKRGQNEGFRVLDDFVCQAIQDPAVPQAPRTKRGRNEGVLVLEELTPGTTPTQQANGDRCSGYQVMMDSLHVLDPDHPDHILSQLPEEILEAMLQYAQRYDPSCTRTSAGLPPAVAQVRAAQRWIEEQKRKKAEPNLASSSE